ncbi:MAG: Histidine--tRNA ligase [Candidatus Omnitrophica bacterium]|nr:Histidine--tRNA ligase [Candidatus Omnitrophota bacterium]
MSSSEPQGIQRLKGTEDILGDRAVAFERVESAARKVFKDFGFKELRTPYLEEKDLFCRALGSGTDVVQKEMYEFRDKSDELVALRPEGTAGVVRAYLENNCHKTESLSKFFYVGPMFRRERPQKGRLRQFHQLGVEQLGADSPLSDAETIHCLAVFLETIGLKAGDYRVKLNNIGYPEERRAYRAVFGAYLTAHRAELCEDCHVRLEHNVLRVLDCKQERCRQLVRASGAGRLADHLSDDSKRHHEAVQRALDAVGVRHEEDPFMIRGLDYYTKTVFEFTHAKLGSQDALAAGGRYDGLVELFGGPRTGAVGFAAGLERLLIALQAQAPEAAENGYEDTCFVIARGEEPLNEAYALLARLRRAGLAAVMDLRPDRSFKSLFNQANKVRARWAIVLGEDELKTRTVKIKDLQHSQERSFPLDGLEAVVKDIRNHFQG